MADQGRSVSPRSFDSAGWLAIEFVRSPELAAALVVIVTYNHRPELERCLASLGDWEAEGLEVAVCDNASTDGTLEWVQAAYPQVRAIANAENVGFGRAVNRAVADGLSASTPAVILLNPDTEATPGWANALLQTADSGDDVGIVQSKLLLLDSADPPRVNSLGNALHFAGHGYCSHLNEPDRDEFQQDREIASACGAAMLIRREVFADIGGFDYAMFLYHEDTDFCVRARLAGWRVLLSAGSVVRHGYEFDKGLRKYYLIERNRWLSLLKTYRVWTLARLAPGLLLVEAAVLAHAARRGWLRSKLRSYRELIALVPHWRAERRRMQTSRRRGDDAVLRHCTSQLQVPGLEGSRSLGLLNCLLGWYWRVCQPGDRRARAGSMGIA